MMRSRRFPTVLMWWAVLLSLGVTGAGLLAAAQPASNDPLRIVPADALFCVRLNRLSVTLTQVDAFLTGISPVGLSMPVQAKIGALLGAPQPAGVNMAGDFAVFGPLPGGEKPDMKRIGVLVPLSNLQQFLTNPNVAKPDAQGILLIGPQGKQTLAGAPIGNYLLLTGVAYRQALIEAKSWTSATGTGSLTQRLGPENLKRATNAPAWAYANIQIVAKMYGPTIQEKLKEATKTLQQMQAKGGPVVGPPEAALGIWTTLLNSFLAETQMVTLSVDPTATALRLTPIIAAVPNTDMATILSSSSTPLSQPNLAGYMENGAIVTGVANFNPAFVRALTLKRIDLLAAIAGPSLSPENVARLKKLAADASDAAGGAAAVAFSANPKTKPPFRVRRVVTIRDKQKLSDTLDEFTKLMQEGVLAEFGKKFGMKMQFTFQRNAETYKEVPIDTGLILIQPLDANSPQGRVIRDMYGAGLNLRMALVNDLLLTVVSAEPETEIHALIDQVKSGTPAPMPSEVQAALQLVPEAKSANFFGTYNEVRALEMFLPFLPLPAPSPPMPTHSDIAFAGTVGAGRLLVDIAIPKQQVLEVKEIFMQIHQKMQPPQKPAQPGAQPPARAPGQT